MKSIVILLFACIFHFNSLHAQIATEDIVLLKLAEMQLQWLAPTDAGFKMLSTKKHSFQATDWAIRSRKEGLEIRYLLDPEVLPTTYLSPKVHATRLALHLATNNEDYVIAEHDIDENSLTNQYHADWGRRYFFKPKDLFSHKANAEIIALYKEGKGLAYIIFLFDTPPPSLEYHQFGLQFMADREVNQ
jgi:hypothetical protein